MVRRTWLFGLAQARSCVFAVAIFVGLAASTLIWKYVDMPIARYDALLGYVLVVQVAMVALKLETGRELLVICCFHLLGLCLEIYKNHVGSWSYPDPGVLKVLGVPVFSGFMYAAVGSYMCQAFRHLELRIDNLRWAPQIIVAALVYANFYTNAFWPDVRVLLAIAILVATWGTWVHFSVGRERFRMPLTISFVLIGGFLWIAENIATAFGAWKYPYQRAAWQLVHVNKFGSWALLVTLSFVLVAVVKTKVGCHRGRWPKPQRAGEISITVR